MEWYYVLYSPLLSVTSITINGNALVEDNSFWVYPEYATIRFLKGILDNSAPRNVVITYSWGHAETPKGIEHICLAMVTNAFNKYRADYLLEGATMGQIANMNLQFDKASMLTAEIKEELQEYRQLFITAIG